MEDGGETPGDEDSHDGGDIPGDDDGTLGVMLIDDGKFVVKWASDSELLF